MQPSIFRIYGLPKLIELDKIKSPGFTLRDFFAPSRVIFSADDVIYFSPGFTSPILIQFTPSASVVIKFFIGLGEAPRTIVATSPNFLYSTPSGQSFAISSSNLLIPLTAILICIWVLHIENLLLTFYLDLQLLFCRQACQIF